MNEMVTEPATLRIGELAKQAGVNVQTIRYYERRGMLERPVRSTGGHREYDVEAVTLLRAIKNVQRLGFTLAEIEEITELTGGKYDAGHVRERAEEKIREIDEKVRDLLEMRSTLERVIEAECDSLLSCSCNQSCPIDSQETL